MGDSSQLPIYTWLLATLMCSADTHTRSLAQSCSAFKLIESPQYHHQIIFCSSISSALICLPSAFSSACHCTILSAIIPDYYGLRLARLWQISLCQFSDISSLRRLVTSITNPSYQTIRNRPIKLDMPTWMLESLSSY